MCYVMRYVITHTYAYIAYCFIAVYSIIYFILLLTTMKFISNLTIYPFFLTCTTLSLNKVYIATAFFR